MTREEREAVARYVAQEMISPTFDINKNAFDSLTTKFHFFCGFLNELVDKQEEK